MPKITRWMLRAAFVYFVLALVVGVAMAASSPLGWGPLILLRPTWIHLLVVGWATQLIFGVAHWIFPRRSRERPFGFESLVVGAFYALNLGLVLRVVAEPLLTLGFAGPWPPLLATSAGLQLLAAVLFVANTWPRLGGR